MAAFINVTCVHTGGPVLVNLDNVLSVVRDDDGTVIHTINSSLDNPIFAKESFDYVVQLIRDYTLIPGWNKLSWPKAD